MYLLKGISWANNSIEFRNWLNVLIDSTYSGGYECNKEKIIAAWTAYRISEGYEN